MKVFLTTRSYATCREDRLRNRLCNQLRNVSPVVTAPNLLHAVSNAAAEVALLPSSVIVKMDYSLAEKLIIVLQQSHAKLPLTVPPLVSNAREEGAAPECSDDDEE